MHFDSYYVSPDHCTLETHVSLSLVDGISKLNNRGTYMYTHCSDTHSWVINNCAWPMGGFIWCLPLSTSALGVVGKGVRADVAYPEKCQSESLETVSCVMKLLF